ncbi:hypothetical protein [Streptomyces sp. enrichment culture]|uniref:hypothetical protein n=1 Tax=Streptomyces sp. enrichment culture TaxID=1795815 RepID=UPI003F56C16C
MSIVALLGRSPLSALPSLAPPTDNRPPAITRVHRAPPCASPRADGIIVGPPARAAGALIPR